MTIATEIAETCKLQYNHIGSVLPPQVCPYCFGCPIATIVVGIGDDPPPQREATPIPADKQPGVREWLTKVEAKYAPALG